MRLIDADALEEGKFHSIENWTPIESASWQRGWNDAIDAIINNAPTVDAVKHGHWIYERINDTRGGSYSVVYCSNCQAHVPWVTKYCLNCGAKMDEVIDDAE